MAVIRTKRKTITDPNGYEIGEVTSKNGKGYHSSTESYESVKEFCESAFIDGYRLAQREFAEDFEPQTGAEYAPGGETPKENKEVKTGRFRKWWEKLSKTEKNLVKAAGITTATALAAAGAYSLVKKHKDKAEDPEVQRAYTYNFIDGYIYAQKEFAEMTDEEKEKEEKQDKAVKTVRNIGIGTSIAGAGTLAGVGINERNKRNKYHKELSKEVGEDILKNDKVHKSAREGVEKIGYADYQARKNPNAKIDYNVSFPNAESRQIAGETWSKIKNKKNVMESLDKLSKSKKVGGIVAPIAAAVTVGSAYGTWEGMRDYKKYKEQKQKEREGK